MRWFKLYLKGLTALVCAVCAGLLVFAVVNTALSPLPAVPYPVRDQIEGAIAVSLIALAIAAAFALGAFASVRSMRTGW